MFIKANKCYHIVKQNTELLIKMIMQQRLHADTQPAYIRSATIRWCNCPMHYRHIESANRKRSYNIHGRPIVFNLTREN